ncbi:MAG: universal stress protein [Methanomassiliicoccales archaeon]
MIILAATDGQPHSEKAVEYAFAFSRAFKAALYVIYVVSPKSNEDKDKNIKNGMRVLGRTKIRGAELGVEVNALLEAGDPSDTIVGAAERIEADLLVIGSSGRSGGLLGGKSTSEQIFKNAHCTVTVVR